MIATAAKATALVTSGASEAELRKAYNDAEYVRSNLARAVKRGGYTGVEKDQARLADAKAATAILRKARRALAA